MAVEKSRLELRICEYAVRSIASPISCTMDSKRWVRTLTVIGSAMAHITIWKLPLQNRGLVIGDALLHDEDGIDAVEAPGVLPEELALHRLGNSVFLHQGERLPCVLRVVVRVVRRPEPDVLVHVPEPVHGLFVTLERDG